MLEIKYYRLAQINTQAAMWFTQIKCRSNPDKSRREQSVPEADIKDEDGHPVKWMPESSRKSASVQRIRRDPRQRAKGLDTHYDENETHRVGEKAHFEPSPSVPYSPPGQWTGSI